MSTKASTVKPIVRGYRMVAAYLRLVSVLSEGPNVICLIMIAKETRKL